MIGGPRTPRPLPPLVSDADGVVRLWDVDDRRPQFSATLHAPQGGVLGVAPLPGSRLLTHGRDGRLRVWRVDRAALSPAAALLDVATDSHGFCAAAVATGDGVPAFDGRPASPPSAVAAVAAADAAALTVWCLDTGARLATLAQPTGDDTKSRGMACAAAFVAGGRLAAGYEDGSVCLWSLSPPSLLASVRMHRDAVMALASVADAVAAAGADATLSFAAVGGGGTLTPGPALALPTPGVAALAVRADGRLLAAACWDGCVRLVEPGGRRQGGGGGEGEGKDAPAPPRPLAELAYHDRAAAAVAFDPGSGLLASGGRDGAVALWRVY